MAKRIYLSPSDQNGNLYAYGGTNEMVQCQKIADACEVALKRCGFEVINNKTDTMEERVAESNAWGADLHVPIHTNAHNGVTTGTRIFSYDTSGEGYKASKAVFNVLAPKTPGTSESVTPYPALYEIRMPTAWSVYVEVDFHDVPKMAKWIIENVVLIGEAIAEGICNYYGVAYKTGGASAKPEQASVMYRVFVNDKQMGAFRVLDNALNAAREYLKNSDDVTVTVREK